MRQAEVVVIGGGVAGLSAAIAAAGAGCEVVLIDEHREPGGRLRRRVAGVTGLDGTSRRADALAGELTARTLAAGVDARSSSVAWGLFANRVVGIAPAPGAEGAAGAARIRAERVVLATGSTDRPLPFPGGSLPGVFTATAILRLIHEFRVMPARAFAVVGAGPEADEVAHDLGQLGASIARVDPEDESGSVLDGSRSEPSDEGVSWVEHRGVRHEVEAVVIAVGRQPDAQLATMSGCRCVFDARLGGYVPLRDDRLETSVPGVYAAGSCAGIGPDGRSVAEGTVAGLAVAASLGKDVAGALDVAITARAGFGDRFAAPTGAHRYVFTQS